MTRNLQKMGGAGALLLATSYVVGIAMYATRLNTTGVDTQTETLNYLTDHQTALLVVTVFIYILAGIALVPLSLAVHERLRDAEPVTMQVATVFGLIWAAIVLASGMIFSVGVANVVDIRDRQPDVAAAAWESIAAVSDGLGGGSELVGAIWVLLVTLAAWNDGRLPRGLNYLGLVIAGAGILTVVPALSIFQSVFGLVQIPWFVWLGTIMVRSDPVRVPQPASAST